MGTKIRDIIDYYADHDVSDEIKERVLERVSGTQDDKEVNDALRNLWNKADTAYMDEEEISAAYNRLLEVDGAEEETKAKQLHIFHFAKIAAIIIPLVMLIAFGKIYIDMSNDLDDMKLISMVQKHTTNDETQLIAMSDGTKVKLSQSSVLLYPSSFKGAKERKVFLSGEAFFDIKHDDNKPFHVSTAHFEITDLGTSFAVSSYTNADEVSTTLKTGKIELRIIGQEDKVYSMSPNDQLVYNVKTKAVKIQRVAADNDGLSYKRALSLYYLWKRNGISFEDSQCEVQISGSGIRGRGRYNYNANNPKEEIKNQRIIIQIVPKISNLGDWTKTKSNM